MKIANIFLLPIMFFSIFSPQPTMVQATDPQCLQHCQEMLSHANVMCGRALPLFLVAGPVAAMASTGCFAAAWASYGICVGYCSR